MSGNVNFNSIARTAEVASKAIENAVKSEKSENSAIISGQKNEAYDTVAHAKAEPLTPEQAEAKQIAHQKAIDEITTMKSIAAESNIPGSPDFATGRWETHEVAGAKAEAHAKAEQTVTGPTTTITDTVTPGTTEVYINPETGEAEYNEIAGTIITTSTSTTPSDDTDGKIGASTVSDMAKAVSEATENVMKKLNIAEE